MESGPGDKPRRQRTRVRKRGSPGSSSTRSGSKRGRGDSVNSSFSPAPLPSRAAIEFSGDRAERPVYGGFLLGFVAVFVIVLLGGSHNPLALGLALAIPGGALAFGTQVRSLGPWVDRSALALMLALLAAFLPLFLVGAEPWRQTAREAYGLSFGRWHTVQPWISFEAWCLGLAGFVWLYVACGWRINHPGRRWLMFWVCCGICLFAGGAVWGNLFSARYPGAEEATAFSYFPNRNQTANFLALGGVVSFGYAMEGLRARNLMHLVGLLATCLCLFALVLGVSRAGVILYFLGVLIWLVMRLRRSKVSSVLKIGVPFVLVIFSIFLSSNQRTSERVVSLLSSPAEWGEAFRVSLYRDSIGMIQEAPWIGHGIGNFSAVFPQYRDWSSNPQQVRHPESDVFWLTAEGGLLALLLCAVFVLSFLRLSKGAGRGRSGVARITALVAVLIFLLHGLVDVSGHRPGTVYFAILFAALALPRRADSARLWNTKLSRVLGLCLLGLGLAWFASGLFRLPLYSETAKRLHEDKAETAIEVGDYAGALERIEEWMEIRRMDWRAYFRRAQVELALTGNRSAAAEDFRRARFLEPVLGIVTLKEGYAWLPYDFGRTISAWRSTLYRELEGKERAYRLMLREAGSRPELRERMIALSNLEPEYRVALIRWLKGELLMREIRKELTVDPALEQFDRENRAAIIHHWIDEGDLDAAEDFLKVHGERLEETWRFWSVLRKNQARFEEAIRFIREAVSAPPIPDADVGESSVERLQRSFMTTSRDVSKGTALLRIYIQNEDYARALEVANRLVQLLNPPTYAYYWRAESLYQLGDYIESWDAFQAYLKRVDD